VVNEEDGLVFYLRHTECFEGSQAQVKYQAAHQFKLR
jgi:GTP cyclohydrolase II